EAPRGALARLHRASVAIAATVPADCRDARAGGQDAHNLQRVASRDLQIVPLLLVASHGAKRIDRLRQRKLLPRESGNKAPAANLAARLGAAQDREQLAPGRGGRFARKKLLDNQPIAPEKLPRPQLDKIFRRRTERIEQGP